MQAFGHAVPPEEGLFERPSAFCCVDGFRHDTPARTANGPLTRLAYGPRLHAHASGSRRRADKTVYDRVHSRPAERTVTRNTDRKSPGHSVSSSANGGVNVKFLLGHPDCLMRLLRRRL